MLGFLTVTHRERARQDLNPNLSYLGTGVPKSYLVMCTEQGHFSWWHRGPGPLAPRLPTPPPCPPSPTQPWFPDERAQPPGDGAAGLAEGISSLPSGFTALALGPGCHLGFCPRTRKVRSSL